jgi:lysophospholipase L1-like esterase
MALIDSIKYYSPESKIYIHSLFPVFEKYHHLNKAILQTNNLLLELANSKGCIFIDMHIKLKKRNQLNPNYAFRDGYHLSAEGYLLWKEELKKYLSDTIEHD